VRLCDVFHWLWVQDTFFAPHMVFPRNTVFRVSYCFTTQWFQSLTGQDSWTSSVTVWCLLLTSVSLFFQRPLFPKRNVEVSSEHSRNLFASLFVFSIISSQPTSGLCNSENHLCLFH
jgi:hypothetical protein